MTSELRVTTLSNVTGDGPVTLTQQSACKSWLAIDQIGTTAIHGAGEASFNISSIVDNSTGTTEFDFTNNFSNENYCGTASSHYSGIASHASPFPGDPDEASQTTSGTLIQCYVNAGSIGDASIVTWHGMGDLA